MYRVNDNPLTRYPQGKSLDEDLGKWAVAHLKSRREKAFAQELAVQRISYYLPLYENRLRRRDTGKVRKTVNPLFPGYVAFAQGENTKKQVFKSGHVAHIIEVKDQSAFIQELLSIQRVLGEGVPVQKHDPIASGDKVKIILGPLTGIEGTVVEWGNTAKVVMGVKMFGQSVSVEVEPSFLYKVSPAN